MKKALVLIMVAAIAVSGCGKKKAEVDKGKIIAKVNGEGVYTNDLKRALALKTINNPTYVVTKEDIQKEIDLLIGKKIMIQEAVKQGLDQTTKFVNTIQTFWEQTLIRDLMDSKGKDINALPISNEEKKKKFQEWMQGLRKQAKVTMQ